MKEYKIKDEILKYMIGKEVVHSRDIAKDLKIVQEECINLFKRLYADGFIIVHRATNPPDLNELTKITTKGELFLDDGGYAALHKKHWLTNLRKNANWAITIAIALGGLYLTYWQAKTSDRTNMLEDKNAALKKQVDSLIDATNRKTKIITDTVKKTDTIKGK